jgi:hypothetical protein
MLSAWRRARFRLRLRYGGQVVLPALLWIAMMSSSVQGSEPVLLHAAGSLRGALNDVAKAFEAASGVGIKATYGPSGTLRDAIAGGERAEVFASANMAHPQSLARDGKSGAVVLFARRSIDAAYFAMRRLARFCAIEEKTLLSWVAWLTSKYMLGLLAQFFSSVAFPSMTRTV